MTFHSKHPIRRLMLTILLACTMMLPVTGSVHASAYDPFPFVLLSCYRQSIPIDGEFLLVAFTSNGDYPPLLLLRNQETRLVRYWFKRIISNLNN